MLFFKNIAVENTLARYKEKFNKNPNAEGYLFFSEDYQHEENLGGMVMILPLRE